MSLKVALELWLSEQKTKVEAESIIRYEQDLAPARQHLGPLLIKDISPLQISNMYREMDREGRSLAKQARTGSRLRQAMKRLVDLGLIPSSPAAKVPLPRPVAADISPMTAEQARQLLKAAEGDPYEALYWLALDTGARQGELWALSPADIDLDAGEVYIQRSLKQERGCKFVLKRPKTAKGRRRIPLTRETTEKLRHHMVKGTRKSARGDQRSGLPDAVFTAKRGGWLRNTYFRIWQWEPLLEKAGLPYFRFHDLRHTCATLLLLANVHPKVVSERLGHSKIEITLNTYSHLLPGMQTSAVTALSGVFTGQGPEKTPVQG